MSRREFGPSPENPPSRGKAHNLFRPGLAVRFGHNAAVNFARDVVDAADPARIALVTIDSAGRRDEHSFAVVADGAARLAGTLEAEGVRPGDAVMTVIGNRLEWVLALVACFRIGAVALPCSEQLRAADLRARMDAVEPKAVLCDERNEDTVRAAGFGGTLLIASDERLLRRAPAAAADMDPSAPALVVFTSGTSGAPKPIRHGQRYLAGQRVQAEHWFGARPGELAWCTAASGWSKSARNSFIAPWLRGATALLHDARFDPAERLELIERERVAVLCMAPTEFRVMAKRTELRELSTLRHAVAAGEPLNPEIVHLWQDRVGVAVHDGYGQTETGALTGMPLDRPVRPGSMGVALPGFDLWVDGGELCADPATVPTFFIDGPAGPWRTGDRVSRDEDGYLWFEGRTDDVIISAGYRIGPFEVESALVAHPDVAEAAAVAAPDDERGQVVRAVVVLRDGAQPGEALARRLQDHVKEQTAPYKYPRVVEFAESLPKTASGKIKRAELRRTS